MKKNSRVYRGRVFACAVIAVAAGVGAGFALPAQAGNFNWIGVGTSWLIWLVLFYAFCWRR